MNMKRMRGRNHRPNGGGGGGGGGGFRNQQNGIPLNRNHVFDSQGPEMRVRGTSQQLYEKYQQMARDAQSNGDRVLGEAYYQHAEHYFRIISAINQAQGQPNQPNGQGYQGGNGQTHQNGQGGYDRRQEQTDVSTEPQPEAPRQQERRFEPRPFEPRNKPEFRNDRQDRYRPEPVPAPAPDTRIDISSALEAELAATIPEPAFEAPGFEAPGFGEQPAMPEPAAEARAIPIIPDAPPAAEEVRAARPRGRPRLAKTQAPE